MNNKCTQQKYVCISVVNVDSYVLYIVVYSNSFVKIKLESFHQKMFLFISENYCGDKIFTEIELIIARKLNKVIIWSVHSFI